MASPRRLGLLTAAILLAVSVAAPAFATNGVFIANFSGTNNGIVSSCQLGATYYVFWNDGGTLKYSYSTNPGQSGTWTPAAAVPSISGVAPQSLYCDATSGIVAAEAAGSGTSCNYAYTKYTTSPDLSTGTVNTGTFGGGNNNACSSGVIYRDSSWAGINSPAIEFSDTYGIGGCFYEVAIGISPSLNFDCTSPSTVQAVFLRSVGTNPAVVYVRGICNLNNALTFYYNIQIFQNGAWTTVQSTSNPAQPGCVTTYLVTGKSSSNLLATWVLPGLSTTWSILYDSSKGSWLSWKSFGFTMAAGGISYDTANTTSYMVGIDTAANALADFRYDPSTDTWNTAEVKLFTGESNTINNSPTAATTVAGPNFLLPYIVATTPNQLKWAATFVTGATTTVTTYITVISTVTKTIGYTSVTTIGTALANWMVFLFVNFVPLALFTWGAFIFLRSADVRDDRAYLFAFDLVLVAMAFLGLISGVIPVFAMIISTVFFFGTGTRDVGPSSGAPAE